MITCFYVAWAMGFTLFVISLIAIALHKTNNALIKRASTDSHTIKRQEKEIIELKAEITAMNKKNKNNATVTTQPIDFIEYS